MPLVSSYSEAFFVTPAVAGRPGQLDATALNTVGTKAEDQFQNEYIYAAGVASCVEGFAVTFDEAGVTTALAANAKGPVALATGAIISGYGWFARKGQTLLAQLVADTADNAFLGRETTDGYLGDGRAAGDEIYGVISRQATTAAALGKVQAYDYMWVDDVKGA